MQRRPLRTVLAITVAAIWTLASIDSIVFNRPVPSEIITPVMLIVVGAYMARRNGNGNGDH